jgi:hypothetical protein
MTPGGNYLGINSIADAKRWPGIPLLILSSEQEAPRVKPVAMAFAGPNTKYRVVPGSNRHGTRMFGKVKGIEKDLAGFLRKTFGAQTGILVPRFDPADPLTKKPGFIRKTLRMSRVVGETTYILMTFAKGSKWTLSAMVKGKFQGKVRIQLGAISYQLRLSTEIHPKGKTGPHKGQSEVAVKTIGSEQALKGQSPSVSVASFRGFHWVTLDFPLEPFWKVGQKGISLHFLPTKGGSVDLPSKGSYRPAMKRIPILSKPKVKRASPPSSSGSKRH